jgi:hypothetical protein
LGELRRSLATRSEPPPFVTRWDLDKTYLRSDFATARDLVQSVLERPDQKRTVPGAALVLRELQRQGAYVHVLSGSPRQLKGRLEQRLALDGVAVQRFTLKPNLGNLLRLRIRALKAQLGYKLSALLQAAHEELDAWQGSVPEVLLGDDSEQDALVYSMFADICQGTISGPELGHLLELAQLYDDERETILRLAPRVAAARGSTRFSILIHLDRQTPPSRFQVYGHRLVPFFNYAQAALVLLAQGQLDADAVLRVLAHLILEHRFDLEGLTRSFLDLHRRGVVPSRLVHELGEASPRAESPLSSWALGLGKVLPMADATGPGEASDTQLRIDYRSLIAPRDGH